MWENGKNSLGIERPCHILLVIFISSPTLFEQCSLQFLKRLARNEELHCIVDNGWLRCTKQTMLARSMRSTGAGGLARCADAETQPRAFPIGFGSRVGIRFFFFFFFFSLGLVAATLSRSLHAPRFTYQPCHTVTPSRPPAVPLRGVTLPRSNRVTLPLFFTPYQSPGQLTSTSPRNFSLPRDKEASPRIPGIIRTAKGGEASPLISSLGHHNVISTNFWSRNKRKNKKKRKNKAGGGGEEQEVLFFY